jgi:competence protein ComEA
LNRADALKDHQKIYVPAQGEDPAPASASVTGEAGSATVNVNEATAADLDRLPGVGPTTAKKIIDFRTKNGPFAAPEDLQNVPGMTAKKFEQLKDQVSV